jgi:transcription antitermination factor NusG
MYATGIESHWYALQVAPKREDAVAALLRYKGYEQYVPSYQADRHMQDTGKKVAENKLFPGYVFCRFSYEESSQVSKGGGVVTTPGVVRVLGGRKPAAIAPDEIEAIRLALAARLKPEPWPFQIGQKVKIETGPLRGVSGIVIRSDGNHRLVLSVELLQRSVAATVQPDWISPIVTIGKALDSARALLAAPDSEGLRIARSTRSEQSVKQEGLRPKLLEMPNIWGAA